MYVGTQFNWVDKSAIETIPEVRIDSAPLYAATFSSDMGPEEFTLCDRDNFFDLYGQNMSFAKHGQPLIQTAGAIANGAKVLCKRVVATDASLANIVLVAEVSKEEKPKTNAAGEPLYIQEDGTEDTAVTENPAMEKYAKLAWKATSIENASSMLDIENLLDDPSIYIPEGSDPSAIADVGEGEVDFEDGDGTTTDPGTTPDTPTTPETPPVEETKKVFSYPLFMIVDNGRGESTKKVRFTADYDISKGLNFAIFNMYVMNGTEDIEGVRFTADPEIIYAGANQSITNQGKSAVQIKVKGSEVIMDEFMNKLAECAEVEVEDLKKEAFLLGKNRKGKDLDYIVVDTDEGLDITAPQGINLLNGDNGTFKNAPIKTQMYIDETVKVWDGTFSDEVWDRDTYKIAAVFDANYDPKIKKAIEELAKWREDFVFFEDMGTELSSFEAVNIQGEEVMDTKFVYASHLAYEVVDSFSKRQIPVTYTYSLSKLFINHFVNGVHRPLAGLQFGMIIPDAIEGTVNFIPKITKNVNQKTLMEEIRINYASYIEGQLVLETMYTHQSDWTQLSFANNVLAIQEVARAVRTKCPSIRYSFITGAGLEIYKNNVSAVLANYIQNFQSLNFVYVQDKVMEDNKVFKAAIEFRFNNFVQTEIFDLIALPTE